MVDLLNRDYRFHRPRLRRFLGGTWGLLGLVSAIAVYDVSEAIFAVENVGLRNERVAAKREATDCKLFELDLAGRRAGVFEEGPSGGRPCQQDDVLSPAAV